MSSVILQELNFIRVYIYPNIQDENLNTNFCFSNKNYQILTLVDWFNPFPLGKGEITYEEWENKYKKECEIFISKKKYAKPNVRLLCITDFNSSFIIENKI